MSASCCCRETFNLHCYVSDLRLLPSPKRQGAKLHLGVRPRVEDSRRGFFACAWYVVSSQLGEAEAAENRPALVELKTLRQLVVRG